MISINVSGHHDVTVVEVSGRIDSMNANQLSTALSKEVDEGNHHLVLDLNGVDYMSSAGLREMVAILKKVKRVSGDLRIAQPSERVSEVFEMAGLYTIFKIYDTQAEAVESY
jgi:anti-sigma B factor antagonist